MKVLIIGAGTTGPILALALKRSGGHDVEIYERAETTSSSESTMTAAPGEVGGGFTVHCNFQRVLKRLGVLDALVAESAPFDHVDYLGFDDAQIARLGIYNNMGDGLQLIGTLRSTLSRVVWAALEREGVRVRGGKRLVAIEQPEDGTLGVRAVFSDGTVADGDILVGADGVNSATRTILFPEVKPVRSDFVGYLGVAKHNEDEQLGLSNRGLSLLADTEHGRSGWAALAGPGVVNWGLFETRKGGEIAHDSWDAVADVVGERERMSAMAERWGMPGWFRAVLPKTVRMVPVSFSHLEPMATWHKHNCVLIGDAAHAILPFVGSGAAIAAEDAEVLATLLAKFPDDPRRAFGLLYEVQASRAYAVSKESVVMGQRTDASTPTAAFVGKLVMKLIGFFTWLFHTTFTLGWIYDYDSHSATLEVLKKHGVAV